MTKPNTRGDKAKANTNKNNNIGETEEKTSNEGAKIEFTMKNDNTAHTTPGKVIPKDNSESGLLKLPTEVKQRIWTLAVTEDNPITPIQIKAKSNKFIWSVAQINNGGQKIISAVPQLAAVQLSKVCRTLYEEVALTHLFYRVNIFDLTSSNSIFAAITYLVAITEARVKCIRSIKVFLKANTYTTINDKFFTLLQTCSGLRSLDMALSWRVNPKITTESFPGLKELIAALHVPEKFSITLKELPESWKNVTWALQEFETAKTFAADFSGYLKGQLEVTEVRAISISKLRMAQEMARLEVHGEGRLGEDKKPGVVSSRTRQGIRKAASLNLDGTLAQKAAPKYDAEGEITWFVTKILSSREVSDYDGTPMVEFQVALEPSTDNKWWEKSELPGATTSWENLATLTSLQARSKIVEFYEKDLNACGISFVVDAWKDISDWTIRTLMRILHLQEKRKAAVMAAEAAEAKAKAKAVKKGQQGSKAKKTGKIVSNN